MMSERFRVVGGVALAVAAVAFMSWVAVTGARWRGSVDVVTAESHPDGHLVIEAKSCNGNPELSHLEETDQTVEVLVVSSWDSLFFGGDDCLDPLEIRLDVPLGDRELIDLHSRTSVRVIELDSSS